MSTVFLLGSGISIDAKMPCVRAITAQVVSGVGVWLDTQNVFVLNAADPNYPLRRRPVEPVLQLVRELHRRAAAYIGREPTYEELSQFARQLDDAISGEYETAAVMPLVAELLDVPYFDRDYDRLRHVTGLTRKYIADTVCHMLAKRPARLDHLTVIMDACKRLSRVDIATLNHDLVLETALDAYEIAYEDGFEQTDQDVRIWTDEWRSASVRLLKLHGSLDWWGYRVAHEPWRDWIAARYVGDDATHPARAGFDLPHDSRPIVLTGTFDKILAYETWLFPDQHLRFHQALREAQRVVAIGYGFGDKAINTRLISWLARSRESRLIVCHPDPDRLSERARGAIRNKWARWQKDRKLASVPAYVDDLSYEALAAHLG